MTDRSKKRKSVVRLDKRSITFTLLFLYGLSGCLALRRILNNMSEADYIMYHLWSKKVQLTHKIFAGEKQDQKR